MKHHTRSQHVPELVYHDILNILVLPILSLASIAGLLGWLDTFYVTVLFVAYITFDFIWLYLRPTSVPSLSKVVMGHHLVTLALLSFPFRHRDFGHFTCWDGLTELNTWFMVVRRQSSQQRALMHNLYWLTFIPMRLVVYPALLVKFWLVLEGFPLSERLLVCVCQFLLCCFNVAVLYLSIARRMGKAALQQQVPVLQKGLHAGVSGKIDRMQHRPRLNGVLIQAHGVPLKSNKCM